MVMAGMAVAAAPAQQQPAKPRVKEKKGMVAYPMAAPVAKGKNMDSRLPDKMEVEMARQDVIRICNPDFRQPFSSIEDACERLLPYHVVAEYEPDEMEVSTSEASNLSVSRLQAWNENMKSKSLEYMATLEKQISSFNVILKRRAEGDMRGEERLLVEKWLLLDEKQKLADARAQIEAKERAERAAAEARLKEALAQAERARAEAQAQAEAKAKAEAALQAEVSSQQEHLEAGDTGEKGPQSDLGGEGLNSLEGWGTSEGEEEDDDDVSEGLFAEEDGRGNGAEFEGGIVNTVQNEFGEGDELQFSV